jgi:hypothetical protein
MKSKEEIEQLAFLKYPRVINDNPLCRNPNNPMEDDNTYERKIWIGAYTQCQEDMAIKKYTEEDLINFAHFYFQETFNSAIQTCKSTQQILQEWFNSLNKQD